MSRTRYYSGVGSRRAPASVEPWFREVVQRLNTLGYVARSGAADGPDTWVERYATQSEIFLPWGHFNGSESRLFPAMLEAHDIASDVHPAWDRLRSPARMLHARNAHQVLGRDLRTPSDFVVCWTPGGKTVGGTATAIRIAERHQIPVFNLAADDGMDLFRTERVFDQIVDYARRCMDLDR